MGGEGESFLFDIYFGLCNFFYYVGTVFQRGECEVRQVSLGIFLDNCKLSGHKGLRLDFDSVFPYIKLGLFSI